jgi:AcrR family transcriptional regulator
MVAKTAERATALEPKAQARSVRDRLLAAADELFYAEGVHVVGVDRIVERAGVTKASLYNIFGSKDELVRAYLEQHFRERQRRIAKVLAAHHTPRERLLGVFAEIEGALASPEFRGCRFIRATAEALPGEASEMVAEEYRTWLRSLFTDLATAVGAGDPKQFGIQLFLLYDGAAVAARMDKDRGGAARAVRAAVVALLDTSLPTKRRNRRAS